MSMTSRQVCTEPLNNLYKHEVTDIFASSLRIATKVALHHNRAYGNELLAYHQTAYNPYQIVTLADIAPQLLPTPNLFWMLFKEAEYKDELHVPEHLITTVKELSDRIEELDKEIPQVKQYFLNAFNRSTNIHVVKKLLCDAAFNLITTQYFESPGDWDNAQKFPQEVITEFHHFNRPYELMVRNRILRNMLINPN
jgi:hypothetical protein